MSTREIRTSEVQGSCEVCGRTLLRGERAEVFVSGGTRRTVCELCTSRAIHEGWVREGAAANYDGGASMRERRRSLLGRLRSRREPDQAVPEGEIELEDVPAPSRTANQSSEPPSAAERSRERMREPRHVRAVPTSGEQRVASAIDLFNSSEHPRTIAGVARSLGAPTVSVLSSSERTSLVTVVCSWELCWYRYEVDLSDELPNVRVVNQGYELEDLPADERRPTAVADEQGWLALN